MISPLRDGSQDYQETPALAMLAKQRGKQRSFQPIFPTRGGIPAPLLARITLPLPRSQNETNGKFNKLNPLPPSGQQNFSALRKMIEKTFKWIERNPNWVSSLSTEGKQEHPSPSPSPHVLHPFPSVLRSTLHISMSLSFSWCCQPGHGGNDDHSHFYATFTVSQALGQWLHMHYQATRY